jgi:hypothetical protein
MFGLSAALAACNGKSSIKNASSLNDIDFTYLSNL